jgi:hypothetical protein
LAAIRSEPQVDRQWLALEGLESRNLLAVFTVNSVDDTIDAGAVTTSEVMALCGGAAGSGLHDFRISNAPTTALLLGADEGNVTVQNLDLSGANTGIRIASDGNWIGDCDTSGASTAGIRLEAASNNTVESKLIPFTPMAAWASICLSVRSLRTIRATSTAGPTNCRASRCFPWSVAGQRPESRAV